MRILSTKPTRGFTVVELLIVIVIIGILATVSIVVYGGVQKNSARSVILSDLRHASQLMALARTDSVIPDNIDDIMHASPQVQLTLVKNGTLYYSGLTPAQNGRLLSDHCKDLVDEGYGKGSSDYGAGMVDYISGCHVYNTHYLQINGWNGGFEITNPNLTIERLQEYVETAASTNPDHPSYRATLQKFMDELQHRFSAQGGTFPVTAFWNSWEQAPSLPPPDSPTDSSYAFCIQATHTQFTDLFYMATSDVLTPRPGICS